MKKLIFGLVSVCLLTSCLAAEKLEWLTDLPAAQAKAKAEKKQVLLDFTGSDWCPPCKALHKNVLTSAEFESYAKTNYVLVLVDFPQIKELPEAQANANKALAKKFDVPGFPTVIVLDTDGKQVSKTTGYSGEKTEEMLAKWKTAKTP